MSDPNTQSKPEPAPAAGDTTSNSTVTPELSESGGTLGFDAARAMSQAFGSIGQPDAPEHKAGQPKEAPPAEKPAEAAPAEPPAEAKPAIADADALAELLGGPKKAEPKPDADDEPPADIAATDKAKRAWGEQRKALKEERRRREELEAKISELEKRSNEVTPDEIKALREQNEAYENELRVARVEATKEFKDAVVVPTERINANLSAMAKKYEFREADARVAFSEADPEKQTELLVEMASGMNDRDRFRFYEMAEEWQKVQNIRSKVVNNAKLALEKIQAHQEEQQKAFLEERSKQYRRALEKVWNDVSEKAPIFKRREGDEAWNKQIGELESFASNLNWDHVANNDQARAELALRAASAPFLFGLVQNLFQRTTDLQRTLSKYQSAKPGAGGGAPDPSIGTGTTEKPSHEDFLSAIKAGLS